jgi:ADP-heptose:LPS heptosyltransferase
LQTAITLAKLIVQIGDATPLDHFQYATSLLMAGDYETGFGEFEWRWQIDGFPDPIQHLPTAKWSGTVEPGQRILIYGEQGFGDAIMFARYASMLAAAGAEVILAVPRPLERLMRGLDGITDITRYGVALPPHTHHAALLSLPHLVGTSLVTLPARTPYISADHTIAQDWQTKFAELPHPRVGLVWRGGRKTPNTDRKSIELAEFAPLIDAVQGSFISLQIELTEDDRVQMEKLGVVNIADDIGDFADTAGAMANLDLVVCVDSAVAHLAGALALPTITLLRRLPDWRWMLGRPDSPWYPTMHLIRQGADEAWAPVIKSVMRTIETGKNLQS